MLFRSLHSPEAIASTIAIAPAPPQPTLSLDGTNPLGIDGLPLGMMSLDGTTSGNGQAELELGISEEDLADYVEFLMVRENPLDVTEEDGGKKRYKAYRQWLRGKSLFKQSKVDPEVLRGMA